MGVSVQVRGVKNVLRAFEESECDAWAIFHGKDIVSKGVGADTLARTLEMYAPAGSDAVYKLCMYQDIADRSEITTKTDPEFTIGFKLSDEMPMHASGFEYTRKLEERLRKLEDGSDDDDSDKTIGGKIGNALLGLLEQPRELIELIGAIRSMGRPAMQPAPAIGRVQTNFAAPVYSMPGVPPVDPVPTSAPQMQTPSTAIPQNKDNDMSENLGSDEKVQRLAAALDVLEAKDPQIVQHLEKLAKIATDEPRTFKMLLGTLDQY